MMVTTSVKGSGWPGRSGKKGNVDDDDDDDDDEEEEEDGCMWALALSPGGTSR